MKTIYSRIRRSVQPVLKRAISIRFTRNGYFMKITTFVGFCVALGASFISVRANDTPAQAAARTALEQKLNELSHPQIGPSPAKNTPSGAAVVQSGQSATNVTETVPAKAVTAQTDPVATIPVAAPAAVTPAAGDPVAVSPAVIAPTMPFLILSLLFLSLLLIVLLIMFLLLLKLRQLKLMLLNHPAIVAPGRLRPAAAKAGPSTERRGSRIKG
jgi:hypothetical protein